MKFWSGKYIRQFRSSPRTSEQPCMPEQLPQAVLGLSQGARHQQVRIFSDWLCTTAQISTIVVKILSKI